VLAAVVLLAEACGGGASRTETAATTTSKPSTTTTSTTTAPTITARPSTTTTTRPTTTTTAVATTTTPPATTAAPSARPIDQLADVGGATKVMTVDAPSWASDTATVILWQRSSRGWAQVAGPWMAWTGQNGWAYAPGESTLRSPIGSFTFGVGFGLAANPGYRLGWFAVGSTDYWVEDPASAAYNTHQLGPTDEATAPWGHFERLADQPVAYQYAALIDFNVPPTGHARGSGIFLHVSKGHATAGCVALPVDELVTALRWIDGGTRIVMGPDSVIRGLHPGS
jgi:L,D-peptidoglycan transpeptidase YkuD (ErfK/YbiS/YcfS/YnhG family)